MRLTVLPLLVLACVAMTDRPWLQDASVENPHAYFERLSRRPDAAYSYSLRDQAQLNANSGRRGSRSITYDPGNDTYPFRQDAAKVLIEENRASISSQVRVPIAHTKGSLLLTWDAWWGQEYVSRESRGGLNTHKTFQIASPIVRAERYIEIRNGYSRVQRDDSAVSNVSVRDYARLGPNTKVGTGDRIEPHLNEFIVRPQTWTRYWAWVELRPDEWDRFSLWVADETRGPVQILDRAEIQSAGSLTRFWFEYNSSQRRTGGPLTAYVRNFVALRDVPDPKALFVRPVAGARLPPLRAPKSQ